jgi:diguanylate cyclase (GGDEF)-like protein/PAS domain S-box-containing protein
MKRAKNPTEGHFKELPELRQRVTALETLIKELRREADILRALKNAVETMQLGVTITDTEGMIIYTTAVEARMHGYSVEELIGKNVRIFAPSEQWQPMKSEQLKKIERWKRECENIRKDGSTFPVQLLSNIFVDAEGTPLGIISTSEDITERKLAEKKLLMSREDLERQVQDRTAELSTTVKVLEDQIKERKAVEKALWKSEQKLRDIASSLGEGIYVLNEQEKLTFMNQEAERLLGRVEAELINGKVHDIIHSQKADGTPLSTEECPIHNILKTGNRFVSEEEVFTRRDGKIFPVFVISTPIIEEGKVTAVVTAFRDITERKRLEEKVSHQAHYDFLTDLPNKMLFLHHLSHALTHARRNRKSLAVLFLDLDHFKKINDSLGHAVGDELLKCVARTLKCCIRADDIVARIGGDEFSILLPEIAHANDAGRVAGKIISYLRKPLIVDGHEFHITTSIGISIYPEDSDHAETLLKNADIAMYHAKEQGKKNYQFYNPAMNVNSSERIAMENQLFRTLERGELSVYYQPIVSTEKRRLFCSEALVRWRHPELGLLGPSRFIPLAEETGFIIPIGEWVLRTACAQNKEWQESGYPPFRMTVNLSAHQLQDPDLVEKTSHILSETGLNPEFLELEITEGTAMRNVEHTISTITRLTDMGIRFAIDDFGIGYSSLSYLKKLPIQTLKIDKSFIMGITADPSDKAIVNAVIAMAHNLNLNVVAEGVETEGQMSFLQLSRCDGMQGYLVSRPLPAHEFKEVILA